VNHARKRITVVFRGSSVSSDWAANFKLRFIDMKLHGPKSDGPAYGKVHAGFYNYLFGPTKKGYDGRTVSKADSILGRLHLLFAEHSDYTLYVTGHSLGAALSTLFSFRAAHDNDIPNKPVMNISFASPYVGDSDFLENFQEREKTGHIRHLRVTNEDDVVPLLPNMGFEGLMPVPYKHVGLNLKFYKDKGWTRRSFLRISYPQPGSWMSGIWRTWDNNLLTGITFSAMQNHKCSEYRTRIDQAKDELNSLPSLEVLYHDKKHTGELFK
jgi:hypothetical protein